MSKEAMKQALDFLRSGHFVYPTKIATDLEEALAKQEGQSNFCPQCEALARELKAVKQEQGEPVAYLVYDKGACSQYLAFDDELGDMDGCTIESLYTTPQQRKPLTDEQLFSIINPSETEQNKNDFVEPVGSSYGITYQNLVRFARAIEAAHNIKE